ncbi:MAG TPA: serine/threonine protein kinase [Candidatus Yaniella excrementigallinarum]|nr:serine/threonine protein kinase [Candidatus Yaniella excrementigallinarum]
MSAGRYQLGEVLGVGSFATVYRAADQQLDDTVVVKMLAENHSLNPEIRERFIAEGRSLRRIASEHVVTVHDIGESSQQQPFLVLELADRGTLAHRVQVLRADGWQPSIDDVLSLARPLADALKAVHAAQLVHRDLNPGNILLAAESGSTDQLGSSPQLIRADERLLLADLGMCKDLALNSGLTVSGGTAGFRPPEQTQAGVVDTRADIWSASALLAWITEGTHLPEAFHKALHRGMQTDPEARQQTVAQWLDDIETALAPTPPVVPTASHLDAQGNVGPEHASSQDTDGPLPDFIPTASNTGTVRTSTLLLSGLAVLTGIIGLVAGLFLSSDRHPAKIDDASIAISGPEEVSVGEPVTFTAETEGVDSWIWALPTGTHLVDDVEATMTPTEQGTNEIILRARADDGEELEARHHVTVTE